MSFSILLKEEFRWDTPTLKMVDRILVFHCADCVNHQHGNRDKIRYTQYGFPEITEEFLRTHRVHQWIHCCPKPVLYDRMDQHEKWRFRWPMRDIRSHACYNAHVSIFNGLPLINPEFKTGIPDHFESGRVENYHDSIILHNTQSGMVGFG